MKQKLESVVKQAHPYLLVLSEKIRDLVPIDNEIAIRRIMQGTALLELSPGEKAYFAPVKGTCGPIELSWNTTPVFSYIVFEKEIMEFVKVEVALSRPENVLYRATIKSETAPHRNGEELEVKTQYKKPFEFILRLCCYYFPITKPAAPDLSPDEIKKQQDLFKVK